MTEIFQLSQVFHFSAPLTDANEQVMCAFSSNAAGRAFSTALDLKEVDKHHRKVDNAHAVITNQKRSRAKRNARFSVGLKVHRGILQT